MRNAESGFALPDTSPPAAEAGRQLGPASLVAAAAACAAVALLLGSTLLGQVAVPGGGVVQAGAAAQAVPH